jgi:glycosyltransferase involved in cell wall biosynthesis
MKNYFRFLELGVESQDELTRDYTRISPKYFTLPIEILRKRNCYLATKSSIKALSKNPINFSLIHAHFLENGFVGTTLKNQYSKPLVVTAHGGDVYDLPFRDAWYNTLARFVLAEADQIITVSRFNAEKLLSLGAPSNKLHVIPNGYDEKLFKPIPVYKARESLGLPLNKKILLSVGNLVDVKGHKYLIDAMSYVLKKRNDVILVIVGTGVLRENLEKKARDLDLNDKILFMGGKKHEEIPLWMNACDIFVLPSLNESFGVVIIEAMACGKPVIGTRVGGIPEIISRDNIGILVKPKHSESLSECIIEALEKKWIPKDIIDYAQQYSWTNIVKRILEVYYKVL